MAVYGMLKERLFEVIVGGVPSVIVGKGLMTTVIGLLLELRIPLTVDFAVYVPASLTLILWPVDGRRVFPLNQEIFPERFAVKVVELPEHISSFPWICQTSKGREP